MTDTVDTPLAPPTAALPRTVPVIVAPDRRDDGSVLGGLLPRDVAWAERFDDAEPGVLFPEEAATIARAVTPRQREFASGRWCARRGLAQLGYPAVPILPGERGAPTWPHGAVGAITHCAGYRAAAVARTETTLAIGVDAEPNAPLPDGVLSVISLPVERADLARLRDADPATSWDRLLFCTKETIYKVWYPLVRRPLGFEDAHVRFHRSGVFEARLLVDGPLVELSGRWAVRRGLLACAIVVPAARRQVLLGTGANALTRVPRTA
ncbi:4'-phosphopantetheinyl transferase superfamily protein [Micromonospora lupini]|uniref:4'-phosphopantetheinyl transferase family protein n=1 Tax=Micromonospora lupini TaxID=285679 RepID=UPI002259FDA4|nr:4'-phosphopantetheinyl transferase superfamily protein [Micromonospora lupini]MCX5065747.1 4'-phosphopantetheinyl transferase superfamily protein [Micromonospora lupini]